MGGGGPGMMGPMDRPPLSREEFMELQERQRLRRMLEHSERSVDPFILYLLANESNSTTSCQLEISVCPCEAYTSGVKAFDS